MSTERLDQRAAAMPVVWTITVNGAERRVPADTTLQDLAVALEIADEPRGVAIALDGLVVPRTRWSQTGLADGSRVEVVRAGAGG